MSKGYKKLDAAMKSAEGMMNSPCTISETVQIARGVAEDAITDYHRNQGNVQISMSIQIDILKDLMYAAGMITEEEFRQKYMEKAKELQELQNKRLNPEMTAESADASVGIKSVDVDVKVEE